MNPTASRVRRPGERTTLAVLIVGLAVLLVQQDWLWRWDRVFYDAQLRLWQRPPPEDIVIIAIDEASLSDFGRWPWSRQMHAHLLRLLNEEQPRAIAFDIIFSEPNLQDREGDSDFARAIAASGRVVLPVLMEQTRTGGQALETMPLPELAAAASALGHAHVELDPDGIARSLYRYEGLGTPHWPHLGLALMAVAGETEPGNDAGRPAAEPGGSPMLWYRDRPLLIPFAGPPGHFKHISYGQVMNKDYVPGTFRDKYVLIGTTAVGLGDALPTPVSGFSHSMSGVEINANVLDALRRELAIQPLEISWRIALTGLLAALPMLLFPRRTPRTNLLTTVALLLLVMAASLGLLVGLRLWFPPTAALLAIILSYPLWSWRRLELAMLYLTQELDRLHEQQSHLAADQPLPVARTLEFVQRLLPVDAWCLIDHRQQRIAGSGPELSVPLREVPEDRWLSYDDCLWTRLYESGASCLVGLRWTDSHPPNEAEQRLLDSLFRIKARNPGLPPSHTDKDIRSRIVQVQQAAAQLRELRLFIDDSLANMADGVMVVDGYGQIMLANARASWYLCGDDNATLQGDPVIPLLTDINLDQGEDWSELLNKVLLQHARVQAGGRHRGGRDLLVQVAPLDTDIDSPPGLIFNFSDISLLKATERQRSELLNFLSHDLRSPLVSMTALIELARNTRPSAELAGLLDRMERYTGSTLGLAEQFLQLARAENSDAFTFREVELSGIALNALEQVWGQAQQRKISLDHQIDVDEAWLKGDAGLLERALVNLLDNAIKYSPDGSGITLSLTRRNTLLQCCIADQGEGIPQADLPHLFERFRQVDRRSSKLQRGAGLGLAFVHTVAQRHGGRVEVTSETGKGSQFCLLLPGEE